MYHLSMKISIRPLPGNCPESILDSRVAEIAGILRPLGFELQSSRFYFHPDEEAEARGIEFAGAQIRIDKSCKRPQSVVHLSQIVFSLCALCSSLQFSYTAEVQELSAPDT
jgi:hypothetical protein